MNNPYEICLHLMETLLEYRREPIARELEKIRHKHSMLHIDVLLSDIKLPDIDGYEVARIGKRLRPELKVILMTGYAPSPLPPALQSLVYRVLQKPFALNTLHETVAGALGH